MNAQTWTQLEVAFLQGRILDARRIFRTALTEAADAARKDERAACERLANADRIAARVGAIVESFASVRK